METIQPLEVLAVPTNLVGLTLALVMVWKTYDRHHAVRRMPDYMPGGPRVIAAWRHYRCEIGRIVFHMSSILISVWGFWYPSSGSLYGETAMSVRVVLGAMFAVFSAFDIMSDHRLESLIGAVPSVLGTSLEMRTIFHDELTPRTQLLSSELELLAIDGSLTAAQSKAVGRALAHVAEIGLLHHRAHQLALSQTRRFQPSRSADRAQNPESVSKGTDA